MTNNIQEQFNIALREKLIALKVNFGIDADWYASAFKAISNKSPVDLGVPISEYIDLVSKLTNIENLNCYEFAIVNNTLESLSAKSLGYNLKPYCELLSLVSDYSMSWNDQTEEVRSKLIEDMRKAQPGMKKV